MSSNRSSTTKTVKARWFDKGFARGTMSIKAQCRPTRPARVTIVAGPHTLFLDESQALAFINAVADVLDEAHGTGPA
ncbi:hypothetical protein [Corynebacterium variabile]|uniref:hypothetical protein n=1 Tax=Corynebacterium variabile TaxID=1727 RepID=UPI003F91B1DD